MAYLCFIETTAARVPFMEPLDAETLGAAQAEARLRLAGHDSGVVAHVYDGDRRIVSVRRKTDAGEGLGA